MKVRVCYKDHGVAKNVIWNTAEQVEKGKRKLVSLQKSTQNICIIGFAGSIAVGQSIMSSVAEVTA